MQLKETTKVGSFIEVDCGYNGMIEMRQVKVIGKPFRTKGLFPNSPDSLNALVLIVGTGEVFTTSTDAT